MNHNKDRDGKSVYDNKIRIHLNFYELFFEIIF